MIRTTTTNKLWYFLCFYYLTMFLNPTNVLASHSRADLRYYKIGYLDSFRPGREQYDVPLSTQVEFDAGR